MPFLAPELAPFTIAVVILLAIAAIEGVGLLLGMAVSSMLESVFPTVDLDVDADISAQNGFTKLLGWMNVGKVPLLVVIIAFLASFGSLGYLIQGASFTLFGAMIPLLVVIPLVLVGAMPLTKLFSSLIAKIMPTDESSAISKDSFIGRTGVIVIGTAKKGQPAEMKFKDVHDQTHYVMVEPKDENEVFEQGDSVILSKQINEGGFYAIKNTNKSLMD